MRHYVAYHNPEKMGYRLHDSDPFRVLTKTSTDRLVDNLVWFIESDRESPKGYYLSSVFRVCTTGNTGDTPLQHFASGTGHEFSQPIRINELDWFGELFRKTAHFSLGVPEISDMATMDALCELARGDGYVVPE